MTNTPTEFHSGNVPILRSFGTKTQLLFIVMCTVGLLTIRLDTQVRQISLPSHTQAMRRRILKYTSIAIRISRISGLWEPITHLGLRNLITGGLFAPSVRMRPSASALASTRWLSLTRFPSSREVVKYRVRALTFSSAEDAEGAKL
jgi:hypothetical protein